MISSFQGSVIQPDTEVNKEPLTVTEFDAVNMIASGQNHNLKKIARGFKKIYPCKRTIYDFKTKASVNIYIKAIAVNLHETLI